jgi:hypothetical protein
MWIGIVLMPIRIRTWIGIIFECRIRIRIGIKSMPNLITDFTSVLTPPPFLPPNPVYTYEYSTQTYTNAITPQESHMKEVGALNVHTNATDSNGT